jgi:choline dehydrogenase-like flavoprotein
MRDVIIIGAGGGGAIVAKELAAQGLDVLPLEGGPRFANVGGADRNAYDTAHLFPFSYRELIPYYDWVEHTLPVETSPMGTNEEVYFRGASHIGLPVQTTKDITHAAFRPQENAILQPQGTAGKTSNPQELVFPKARGCTFCGHCVQGCFEPLRSPINLKAKRSTSVSYVPMALTPTFGRVVARRSPSSLMPLRSASILTNSQTRGV